MSSFIYFQAFKAIPFFFLRLASSDQKKKIGNDILKTFYVALEVRAVLILQ